MTYLLKQLFRRISYQVERRKWRTGGSLVNWLKSDRRMGLWVNFTDNGSTNSQRTGDRGHLRNNINWRASCTVLFSEDDEDAENGTRGTVEWEDQKVDGETIGEYSRELYKKKKEFTTLGRYKKDGIRVKGRVKWVRVTSSRHTVSESSIVVRSRSLGYDNINGWWQKGC